MPERPVDLIKRVLEYIRAKHGDNNISAATLEFAFTMIVSTNQQVVHRYIQIGRDAGILVLNEDGSYTAEWKKCYEW